MDSDCGGFFGRDANGNLGKAISDGSVPESTYKRALGNVYRVLMRLGYFDPDAKNPYRGYGLDRVDSAAHRQLALEAARQGMVLVKNDNKLLPLSEAGVKSVAAIGPNANATVTMQSNYHAQAPFLISPVMGLGKYAKVNYVQGCDISQNDTSGFADAVKAAGEADATVVIVGLDQSQESEGHDRVMIELPGAQAALIEAVAKAAKKPIVLVIMSGGPVDVSAAKANPNVGAIIIVGYPGQSGGQAIAETIFGDNNPSGKLTQTWYPAGYINQISMFDMNMRPNATTGSPGRTYR
jgi:beta-glucosidase-like glycosyl hydrolase